MVETWVATELTKLMGATDPRLRLYFWRTHAGREVDFLIERGTDLVAIEVKWSHRIQDSDLGGLKRCTEDLAERLRFSVVLYGGTETVPLASRMAAIPFSVFFGVAE
jgi:predicted AAA+ superfamily ATPase